jgi:quercetin dioxygenase-like cupin family protein
MGRERNGFRVGRQEDPVVHDMSGEKKGQDSREELLGKVLELKDLVAYQPGTVASRMIVFRDAGNITLFSFDEGEGLSEHTAPFDAVVTILDGECEVWVAGETHHLSEGETIIFPANKPHALSAVTRFKMMLTMIRECPK